ncbi:insecticidal delta-endotoxin Cry8Ea1 family protein [Bacillus thuringiensis]|uniref:insecticidal delta-endotoxin Cry8Ea1 family protein n=1 Tax=Bacillus thuringiensis TaxID=1428 RepID=UPI002AB389DB|nr:insecticidal delta-endotoxin Cry8Ea1 family protein [Bacillus thuringiensis]MDY8166262.1 insecticidal delta-endotoxin Cry8Ea1 family protein [Bacillus thuringiensis]
MNNNEYEIIDSHASLYSSNGNINNSRYPYTNNPNRSLQNTNYKDWMNMCQQNQQYGENSQTFASAETLAAVGAGTIIVGTILGAMALPPLGAAGIISFGTILPIIWGSGQDARTVWKSFLTIGNRPFGLPVDEAIVSLLYGRVQALRVEVEDYQRYFDIWHANPIPQNAGPLKSKFFTLDTLIIGALEELTKDYSITLLPGYAQVASWHLMLLKHAAVYYDKWAASSNLSIQSIYPQDYTSDLQTCLTNCAKESENKVSSKYYKCILKCRINEYINYCSTKYQEGLNRLKNSSGINWNIYNTYRREMTLTVLDLIATFPNFDPEKYTIATNSQLTREIYTEALLQEPGIPRPISERESQLTRPVGLFTHLDLLQFHTQINSDFVPIRGLRGVQNFMSFIGGNTFNGPIHQPATPPSSYIEIIREQPLNVSGESNRIYKISVTQAPSSYRTTSIDFNLINGSTRQYRSGSSHVGSEITIFEFPKFPKDKIPPNRSEYSHVVSYVIVGPEETPGVIFYTQLSFAWTHTSVDFNNIIYNKSITQIPAVKAYEISADSKVVKGPGHTGGDLVELKDYMFFKLLVPQGSVGSYKVRIRYASNAPNQNIVLTRGFAQDQNLPQTFNHSNYNDLKYSDFQYATFPLPVTYTGALTDTISLHGLRNNPNRMFIDKIEFIPN